MDDAARAQEMWSQFVGTTLETMTVWADANQRVMKEWVEFTSGASRAGEEHVQTLTRTAEQLQVTAEQAGKGIQATLADAVTKTKEIYARA